MKVISLFDGIGGGRESLKQCGITPECYYAFEIKRNSIKIAKKNFPDIVECGNVIGADFKQYQDFDLLMGGSPCQNFSCCNTMTRQGLDGEKSKLFYEYLRALKEIKPKYFFLENVASMRQTDRQRIIDELQTVRNDFQVYVVDSAEDSPMHRKRIYFTNIPLSESKLNKEVVNDCLFDRMEYNGYICFTLKKELNITKDKFTTFTASYRAGGRIKENGKQYVAGIKTREYSFGFPIDYTKIENISDKVRCGIIGDGWCIPTINRFLINLKG